MNRTTVVLLLVCTVSARAVDFQRDVRPILADNCFKCHGPDEKARKGKLRLDVRDAALKGGRSGPAIVPGKDASELLKRVVSAEPTEVMPPTTTGKKLTPAQVDILRRWIAEGARYDAPWAYVAPKRPAVPAVKRSGWARNPIDLFILARLEKEGLTPAPAAGRETLLRRLSLDLIGLPPTNLDDDVDRAIERLLASPHHGERWGRHWLDAARYADSDGFEKDKPRSVWAYRDWVVRALNADLPYDRFITEQIAGDL